MIIAIASLILTIGIYWGTKRLYQWKPKAYLSPLLITPLVVVLLLLWSKTPYESYNAGAGWLTQMIGPATVALAVPLYKNLAILKKHYLEILVSVLFGSLLAIGSSAGMAKMLHLDVQITGSLVPHSTTTPIAVAVAQVIGGIPSITAVFVLLTGLLGIVLGPLLIRVLRLHHDIAKGVVLGTSAHAAGTSKAFEFGAVSGSISSISMILAAFFTLFFAPLIMKMF